MLLASLLIYLALQFAIVAWAARNIKTDDDYFIAGRRLGVFLSTMSIFATWFGAETCIGSSAAIFEGGLYSSRADPFGYTVSLILMGAFLAYPLWKRKMVTLADLFRETYQSQILERVVAIVIIPTSFVWAAAQMKAFGHILAVFAEVDIAIGVTLAAAVVIGYTYWGGLLGDVVTDVVQGLILIFGLAFLLFVALKKGSLESIEPQKMSFIPNGESPWARLDAWLVPILGALVSQELVMRVSAAKNPKIAATSCLSAGILYIIVGMIPVTLGLLGPQLIGSLQTRDNFLMELAKSSLTPVIYVVFAGALISAILSTVDSALLSVSALLSHNLLGKWFYVMPTKKRLFCSRLMVLVSGVGAYFVALTGKGVYDLVILASSLGTSGLLVVTVMSIWAPRFGNWIAASLTMVIGFVSMPLFQSFEWIKAPYFASIATCLLVFIISSIAVRVRSKIGVNI
jgi:Na+/proline symporter